MRKIGYIAAMLGIMVGAGLNGALRKAPVGIRNVGNSCFMSAALQVYYLTQLTPILLSHAWCAPQGSVLEAYIQFLQQYGAYKKKIDDVYDAYNPKPIYDKWEAYTKPEEGKPPERPQIQLGGKQEDAQEKIGLVFNYMQAELEAVVSIFAKKAETDPSYHKSISQCTDLLESILFTEIHGSSWAQSAPMLQLAVINENLLASLENYFVTGDRTAKLSKLADFFFIAPLMAIKKDGAYVKIKKLTVPGCINVNEYCTDHVKKAMGPLISYCLKGVVGHSGGVAGGHYIAYVCYTNSGKEQWYFCNDSTVEERNAKDIFNALETAGQLPGGYTPTLLMYERIPVSPAAAAFARFQRDLELIRLVARA